MEETSLHEIHEIVRKAKSNYLQGGVAQSEYVTWDMHNTIETIEAYLNSKHLSGETDSLGREKPFFNISIAAANIWWRATDLDRKNIRLMPSRIRDTALVFLMNMHLKDWMNESNFGMFLNEWGRVLSRYGSAVVKFVDKGDRLEACVVPWNRLIVDPIDFEALPRIEKLFMTPGQLRKNPLYNQDVVEDLIKTQTTRKTLRGQSQDSTPNFIEIYEVHGELPIALLKEEKDRVDSDWDTYRQQMHVISYVNTKKGETADFTLYSGKEKQDPYMITHLIPEDGRTLAMGAVEYCFQSQWMTNHSIKNAKDTLDLSSKLIFQTSDANYIGKNVLSSIETGDIMIHGLNAPLTQINNTKADISALLNYAQVWRGLSQEVTSTPDPVRGNTMPSGTPYQLGALLNEQAVSLFEMMTENKAMYLEQILKEFIIPFIIRRMDTKQEIIVALEDEDITQLDAMYVPREAIRQYNEQFKKQLLDPNNTSIPSPYDQQSAEQSVQQQFNGMGNMRSFAPTDIGEGSWKSLLKDIGIRVVVEIVNENTDKQAVLQTLSTVFQTVASNPMVLQEPNARLVFNKILQETGNISPIQLKSLPNQSASPPAVGSTDLTTNPQPNGSTAPAGVPS